LGLQLHVCPLCRYALWPETVVALKAEEQREPCAGQNEFALENLTLTGTPYDFEYERAGHLTYALDVRCESCGRVFAKLVARKDGAVYIPQHSVAVTRASATEDVTVTL